MASWLVDAVNICTGNLDRPGGAMFPAAAAGAANTRGTPGRGRGVRLYRRQSRVRGLPETMGELPAVCLAEEIDTPGDGQIKALLTVAGNPALSTPNADRLDAALGQLDFMVSVDIYVNETTRHADVILPVPTALQKSHYDVALLQLAVRNVANYSPAVLPIDDGQPDEWEVLAKLALIAQGMGPDADPAIVDDLAGLAPWREAAVDDPDTLLGALGERRGPERLLDIMLRTGPYDTHPRRPARRHPTASTSALWSPGSPRCCAPSRGASSWRPSRSPATSPVCGPRLDRPDGEGDRPFLLVGRRHLRSNNSWMHNVNVLVKGKPRCTLQLHPDDADRLGLADGDPALVASRTGSVTVPVEVTDGILPGVVSIPHGWGHGAPGTRMRIASEHAGANSNVLADEELFDPVSGNAVLNGIPVSVAAARRRRRLPGTSGRSPDSGATTAARYTARTARDWRTSATTASKNSLR